MFLELCQIAESLAGNGSALFGLRRCCGSSGQILDRRNSPAFPADARLAGIRGLRKVSEGREALSTAGQETGGTFFGDLGRNSDSSGWEDGAGRARGQKKHASGAKARASFAAFSARLKSRPDTRPHLKSRLDTRPFLKSRCDTRRLLTSRPDTRPLLRSRPDTRRHSTLSPNAAKEWRSQGCTPTIPASAKRLGVIYIEVRSQHENGGSCKS